MTWQNHDHTDVVELDARPQPLDLALCQTAVLVVDMQNDFVLQGGLFDRLGIETSVIRAVVAPTARVLAAARHARVPVVYIQLAFRPNLSDLFEPGSPVRERFLACGVGEPTAAPDGRLGRILIRDTWNTEIVDELKPEPDDVVIVKHGYSAFHETELGAVLNGIGAKYLIFTGCTTSVCVETALREAHTRGYACILAEDCTAEPIGSAGVNGADRGAPGTNYEATLRLVESEFGWVSTSQAVIDALNKTTIDAGETAGLSKLSL